MIALLIVFAGEVKFVSTSGWDSPINERRTCSGMSLVLDMASGDKAEEPSHSMLDDLIEEDPAFATLNKEDAEESSERVPSIPAAPKNEIPAAAGSEDALAQELDNLKIGKDERDQVGTRNAVVSI
jgi:hypothetical protein